MMKEINITCDTCHITHVVSRDKCAPGSATSMGCNWCPNCEDKADDYYNEWYNYSESGEVIPTVPDNQLCIPFELDFIDQNIMIPEKYFGLAIDKSNQGVSKMEITATKK